MNKTKINKSKKNKNKTNLLQRIMNKSKKNSKKLNKTIKDKPALRKCESFCKNDYMVELNKVFKKSSEKYNIPFKSPTKEENEFAYNSCKKSFCNEKCDGYDFFGDKQKQIDFKKKIRNGFQNTYSKEKVEKMKQRGALSGCVDVVDYDAFHK